MPLEIRELIIRAQVGDDTGQNGSANSSNSGQATDGGGDADRVEQLVQEMVERVLDILKTRLERWFDGWAMIDDWWVLVLCHQS